MGTDRDLYEEVPEGLPDILAEMRDRLTKLEERCYPGVAEKFAKIEADVDATAELVEEYLLKRRLEPRAKRRWFTNLWMR